jgi:type I restriction enzyme, S subunit
VSLDTYPRYKNSNIEWIGEVPAHWRVASLRWYASIQGGVAKGKNYNAETPVVDLPYLRVANVQDGFCDLSSVSTVTVAVSEVDRYRLHPGDVLMNEGGDNDKLGRGAVWQGQVENCLHQNHVFAIRPNRHLLPYWLSMFTRSAAARSYFYLYSKQSTNLASISSSNVMSCPLPFPSTQEQRQILGFLDHETAKIDALIREQERLIELLQEKRQAVISHAVTKGLDPDVPMKDSGVEWLGEVPAHWRVGKLRWYATIQGGVAKGKDYQDQKTVSLPYLRVANVQAGYVDLTEVKEIAVLESEIERYSLRHGDVLMNEGGDNDKLGRGTVWRAEIEPCLHQNHVFAIRPNRYLTPEWLAMFTQSSRARSYFFLNSKQSTNLASISSSNVMNLDLPMPSVDEQERILQFLESELQQFTDLQKQADKGIQLLLERRSALISAAVTGKIDVRNWQPPVDESAFDEEVRQAGMEATA